MPAFSRVRMVKMATPWGYCYGRVCGNWKVAGGLRGIGAGGGNADSGLAVGAGEAVGDGGNGTAGGLPKLAGGRWGCGLGVCARSSGREGAGDGGERSGLGGSGGLEGPRCRAMSYGKSC
jgi:hypothetical protein